MDRSIGDRMKENYENPSRHYLTRRMPVIIRLDGRAFHTYTKSVPYLRDGSDVKPFKQHITNAFTTAMLPIFKEVQGYKASYLQSDELSLFLTDYDELDTQPFFGYNKSKLETVIASILTAHFNGYMHPKYTRELATFDARAFNIPREEVVNYFLWRMGDWRRNSVSMYARNFFSHKELHGVSVQEKKNMLKNIGKPWEDLNRILKYGILYVEGKSYAIDPTYNNISGFLDDLIYIDEKKDV